MAILPDQHLASADEGTERFAIGDDLWVSGEALVTGTLSALNDAIFPYR